MSDTPLEKEIQKQILAALEIAGIFCWRQNQGTVAHAKTNRHARRFVRFTSKKGVSDIIGCLPDGKFLAIEVKRPGGKLTADQEGFLQDVEAHGGVVVVAYCLRDVLSTLDDYMGNMAV